MSDQDIESLRRSAAGGDDLSGVRYAFECERRGIAWRTERGSAAPRVLEAAEHLEYVRARIRRGTRGLPALRTVWQELRRFDEIWRLFEARSLGLPAPSPFSVTPEWQRQDAPWVDPLAEAQATVRDGELRDALRARARQIEDGLA